MNGCDKASKQRQIYNLSFCQVKHKHTYTCTRTGQIPCAISHKPEAGSMLKLRKKKERKTTQKKRPYNPVSDKPFMAVFYFLSRLLPSILQWCWHA